MNYTGKLKSWRDDKGFGFIQSPALPKDVFIHISALKGMSRKPKEGDTIHFDVEQQPDGKSRAVNCRIEGVQAINTATAKPSRSNRSNGSKKRNASQSSLIMKLWPVVLLVMVVIGYDKLTDGRKEVTVTTPAPAVKPAQSYTVKKPTAKFKCDDRQHCGQMNSIEEAIFFTKNCPGSKMDGDRDGRPCERDKRLRP